MCFQCAYSKFQPEGPGPFSGNFVWFLLEIGPGWEATSEEECCKSEFDLTQLLYLLTALHQNFVTTKCCRFSQPTLF